MEPSRFNELIAEFERYPVSDEDLNDFIEYLEAEKRERKEQFLVEAKKAFKNFLSELENDYGVYISHDGWGLGLHNVTFDFIEDYE